MKRTPRNIKRLMMTVALCAAAGAAWAQVPATDERFTLTNGRLYWYDNATWVGRNSEYQYEVAFDSENSWAGIHPYHPSTPIENFNPTHITEKGTVYLALDLSGATPAIVSTPTFTPYCVWQRTGATGYYYQLWDDYYYYLVGSGTELRIVKLAVGGRNDDNSSWYNWDFGAAIQEQHMVSGVSVKSYYWMMYDTTGTGALDGTWRMSCNSYERPEDAIYAGYNYLDPPEYNNLRKSYYCNRVVGGQNKPAGNGALYMPVTYVEHDREISTIDPSLGLQSFTVKKDDAPVPVGYAMRYLDVLTPFPTIVTTASNVVGVVPAYTEYVEETYRYGINRDYTQRETETFGSAGVPDVTHHYYYNDSHQNDAPDEEMGPLQVSSYTYSLNNAARRYLTLKVNSVDMGGVAEAVNPAATVELLCKEVPREGAIATLTLTVLYTNGAEQTATVNIRMSQEVTHAAMPEPTHGPVIGGSVFGGARMANVGGNTSITVHCADSIYALYGGNDIAGWVQGDGGATIQLGTAKTDASHPVHIGWVLGGGCGYYQYDQCFDAVEYATNKPAITGLPDNPTEQDTLDWVAAHMDAINAAYNAAWDAEGNPVKGLGYGQYAFRGNVYAWNNDNEGNPVLVANGTWFDYNPYKGYRNFALSETGNNGVDYRLAGTIPYIKTAHISVGINGDSDLNGDDAVTAADRTLARASNDYILIDTLFGGAENAYIGVTADEEHPANAVSIDVYGGTIFSAFGGNNYGGSVAQTSTVFVNVHDTKLPPAAIPPASDDLEEQTFFSGYGREYGIRYLFGGGNMVEGSHANVNITGGMIDTCYLGGNMATVNRPVGTVDCQGDHFICTNPTYPNPSNFTSISPYWKYEKTPAFFDDYGPEHFNPEHGRYNIRCIFGGNNAAAMSTLSVLQLHSGGISTVYGGGNQGDMNHSTMSFENPVYATLMAGAFTAHAGQIPQPTGVGSLVSALRDSKIVCDYVFGGSRMSNVKASCGVYLSGGIFGYVNGGNDVSGDVGSTFGDFAAGQTNGAYVFLDSNVLVVGDVVGGSDGYYHCNDGNGHYDAESMLEDTYSGEVYDPYNLYNDPEAPLLIPTHNNTTVAMKGGLVMGGIIGGGVHANVGFPARANYNKINIGGVESPISIQGGVRHGSIHMNLKGGHVLGNVFGGGYMSSIYGLAYLHLDDTIKIDGAFYAGNDLKGSIEYFGAYTANGVQNSTQYEAFKASNNDPLNIEEDDGSWNARYSTYLRIDGTPRITTVYGSGNGDYDYDALSSMLCDEGNSVPLQSSTYIDINTTGGFIDTVFGGGNGVGVRDAVKVLFNSTEDVLTVGTIFGGNNSEDMITCVPHIELKSGQVNNVFGGGNAGSMRGSTTLNDVCGNTVEDVSSYVRIDNSTVDVLDTVFGGCRRADIRGMAYVDISGGEVHNVFGGNDIAGTVSGNTRIDVSGGTVHNIHGGSNGRYDYEQVESLWSAYLFGETHNAENLVSTDLGGRPFVDSSTVNLWGGTIDNSVYGGGSLGDNRATLVEVNDQICEPGGTPLALTISGNVFGGGEGNWEDLNWHADDDHHRHGNVVTTNDGAGATHVNLRHATSLPSAKAYGGGRGGDVENTYINVYPSWDIPFTAIYGGCWGSDVLGSTNLHLQGSTEPGEVTATNVFGGNDFTGNVYQANLTVESGTYGNIYGGGNGDYAAGLFTGAAGTVGGYDYSVYAGNYTSGDYIGQPRRIYVPNNEFGEVNFLGGTVTGNLYGGGKMGTTMRLARDNSNRFITYGGAFKQADTSMTVGTAYADVSRYSHVFLNIKGGEFQRDVYCGAAGQINGNCLVYGLKQINMDGGLIKVSLHGGSENVNDGYGQECDSPRDGGGNLLSNPTREQRLAATTQRPSSIINITGGTVKNHVYGAGYLGDVHGSSYINVGQEAVDQCAIWTKTIKGQENAYALFKPGATDGLVDALATNTLFLEASIYGGADWGTNTGSADFSKQGYYGGESRILVDGEGYNTYMDAAHESLPLMDIGNSIIGAGTSAEGGDIYNRIDVRNYGAINPNTCKPTRTIRAIQRADGVWLENTAIDYTGSTDAISAYLSSQYTINRVDTLSCVGYNIIDVDATMTNIGEANIYFTEAYSQELLSTYGDPEYPSTPMMTLDWFEPSGRYAYVQPYNLILANKCDASSLCEQTSFFNRELGPYSLTAFVMNNGINIDLMNVNGQYSAVKGFGYIVAQEGTNAVVTARPKYGLGLIDANQSGVNLNDGGFWSLCDDSLRAVSAVSGADNTDLTWCDCIDENGQILTGNTHCYDNSSSWMKDKFEYPYSNYSTQYRVWSIGEGVRRRYAVVLAHANPDKLVEDDVHINKRITLKYDGTTPDSLYNFGIAKAKLVLPPTIPGHYYRIGEAGVNISDENDEMALIDMGYLPKTWAGLDNEWKIAVDPGAKAYNAETDADKQEAAGHGSLCTLAATGPGTVTGVNYIYNQPNDRQYFGLLMSSGANFAVDGEGNLVRPLSETSGSWTGSTTLSGNAHTNMVADFTTAQVGADVNASPELDLYMLYNNNFSHTVAGVVTFTLDEYESVPLRENYDGHDISTNTGDIITHEDWNAAHPGALTPLTCDYLDHNLHTPIEVEITLSTVLEDFGNMEYEVLAMYNEGRRNTFMRKVILPATLQRRELYLEGISWCPTDKSDGHGNGEYLTSASNPTYFYLTGDTNAIKNQTPADAHSYFSMTILPVDNVTSNAVTAQGWHEKVVKTPLDLFTAAGQTGSPLRAIGDAYYLDAPEHTIGRVDLTESGTVYGQKIGTLDGRAEAAIDVVLHFDGSRVYDVVPGKGYIGKVLLDLVSYGGGDYEHPNRFQVIVDVKTREHGDTIYLATPTGVDGSDHPIVTLGGHQLHEGTDFGDSETGRRPNKFITSFYDAFTKVYTEGDVLAIIGELDISSGNTLIKGSVDMPIPVIRYTGWHPDARGEGCVYRGTMVSVSGINTIFTARGIDFQGGMLGKVNPSDAERADAEAWAADGVHKQLYNRVREAYYNYLYNDTNRVYGPVLAVRDNAVVSLQEGIIVEQNHNGYGTRVGDDPTAHPEKMGAISVTDGGILNLANNVTVRYNMSDSLPGTQWEIQPLNGAVVVDGGSVVLQQSAEGTAITIQKNYLNQEGSSYWLEHYFDGKLVHSDFDTIEYKLTSTKHTKSNVLLARTPAALPANQILEDAKSDLITFHYDINDESRIGISKWFPTSAESPRDTIKIAYHPEGMYLQEALDNGVFTSDAGNFMFYNYGVNAQLMYMDRCATFRFQEKTEPASYVVAGSGIKTGDALAYLPLEYASCPTGGDTLMARAQGGFFPYTYRWEDITHSEVTTHTSAYTNNQINKQIADEEYDGLRAAVIDTFFTTHVDMDYDQTESSLQYHLTINDATGNCELTKNVNVTVVKDLSNNPVQPFTKVTDPYDAWKDVEHSGPNEVGNTATGTRKYKGVRITPMVWTPGAGTIAALVDGDPNIYIGTPESPNPINNLSFCEGDIIHLATTPSTGYKFLMWDFDPFYANPAAYMVPAQSEYVVAYFAPENYWKDVVNTEAKAGAAHTTTYYYTSRPEVPEYTLLVGDETGTSTYAGYVTTYNGDVHIYNENGLAWLISVVNGINGNQARPLYFNNVYLHKKDAVGTPYDMKNYLWTPMGTLQYGFRGTLIGVGHDATTTTPLDGERVIVENLIIEEPEMTYVGFFASLDSARVSGIQLRSVTARGSQYVGGFAARSTYSTFDNCSVIDDREPDPENDAVDLNTTILTTHYVSGGFIGKSEHDEVTNSVVKAKFVGNAVYSGGVVGYGTATTISSTHTTNINRMSGLYLGGIAGYLDGTAPVSRFFRRKAGMPSHVANNYVHLINDGHPNRLGGLVGYAENTIMENNYVYGNMSDAEASGGIASNLGSNAMVNHNYYAAKDARRAVVSMASDATLYDTATFSGSGNNVSLSQPIYGIGNLTRALNIWVHEHNAGSNQYKTWRSDLTGVNSGYPIFGTPDLIPVRETVDLDGCGEVEWAGKTYYRDAVLQRQVIDSTLMVDSMLTVNIRIHYGKRVDVADSTLLGHDYNGYGFSLSAAETQLLRSTIDSMGHASVVLTDTLHTAFGCDSIVTLTLTFFASDSSTSGLGDVNFEPEDDDTPTVPEIKVYPNPTTNVVNVETEGLSHVEVYDGEGRLLSDYESHGLPKVTFDVSHQPAGVYYIRIHTVHDVTIQKIIKQ
ncbi:MAG: T9SS type A sorting domain-containing protein [bacterium]